MDMVAYFDPSAQDAEIVDSHMVADRHARGAVKAGETADQAVFANGTEPHFLDFLAGEKAGFHSVT
jgi:hypothetical protein